MTQLIHSPKYFQMAFVDAQGYPWGIQTSPDSVANGTTTSPLLLKNPMQMQEPEPTRDTIVEFGGSQVRIQDVIGTSDYGSGSFQLSSRDSFFESYFKGTTRDTTLISDWEMVAENSNQTNIPRMILAWTMLAAEKDESVTPPTITNKYVSKVYFAQVFKTAWSVQQGGGTNPNPFPYTFVVSPAFRIFTGDLFSGTGMDVEGDNDIGFTIKHSEPFSFTSYKEAGTPAGEMTLGWLPLTTQATTSDKRLTKNGASASITTLSTSTAEATFTAGSAADKFVLTYATRFAPVP
jgi:hypothetical protein